MKSLIGIIILLLGSFFAQAQDYIAQKSNIGVTAGALGYAGRYSVGTSLGKVVSYSTSLFYDHKIILPSQLYIRGEVMFGQLKGDNREEDANGPKGFFKSNILEATIKGQYDILNDNVTSWSPYIIAGAGAYRMFNYTSSNGGKSSSEKLGFILPVGGGVKYRINSRSRIFLEGAVRFLSKNLDNRTGESVNNPNKYYSLAIGFAYSLQKNNQLW